MSTSHCKIHQSQFEKLRDKSLIWDYNQSQIQSKVLSDNLKR